MELIDTTLERNNLVLDVVIMLIDGRMSHDLGRRRIVLFLDQSRVPLDSNVTFLQEVGYELRAGLYDAARASLHPVTLTAAVALAIHHFKHEWLDRALKSTLQRLLPVRLVPPKVLVGG